MHQSLHRCRLVSPTGRNVARRFVDLPAQPCRAELRETNDADGSSVAVKKSAFAGPHYQQKPKPPLLQLMNLNGAKCSWLVLWTPTEALRKFGTSPLATDARSLFDAARSMTPGMKLSERRTAIEIAIVKDRMPARDGRSNG